MWIAFDKKSLGRDFRDSCYILHFLYKTCWKNFPKVLSNKDFFFQKSSFFASVVNHRGFEIPCIFTCHQLFQNFVANLDNFSKACSYLTSDSCCYLLNTSYMTRACINETDFQMDRWFMTFLWVKKIERNCYRYIV